jgi:arylsulfatase A-like enzyme
MIAPLAALGLLALLTPPQSITRAQARGARTEVPPPAVGPALQPNLVVILADDLGVDLVNAYGEGAAPPCTPNLDALAASGILFRNAWANPVCTPTRAALLTGRHGFRTGVGSVGGGSRLPLSELILPEMLVGYDSAAVGKWHLAGNAGSTHPNASGFGRFAGSLGGAVGDYYQWAKTVDGQASVSTTYATTDTADEAVAAMLGMQEPWVLYAAFNAPHDPWQAPPTGLCPPCANGWCANLGQNATDLELGKAMVEALDVELGRVLGVLEAVDPNAWVFFLGDNGSPRALSEAPFRGNHAKGTLYEGGVNVPLIVRGPGAVSGECAGLVSVVDLYATLGELARVPAGSEDSVSMVPYFSDPGRPSLRATVYSETFSPNGGAPPYASHVRAVRGERYKLIRETGRADELYDLELDPFETTDLLPNPDAAQQAAYDLLAAELVALGVD